MPTAVQPSITPSPQDASAQTTTGDDSSLCSTLNCDPSGDPDAFSDQFAAYLFSHRDDPEFEHVWNDPNVSEEIRRRKWGLDAIATDYQTCVDSIRHAMPVVNGSTEAEFHEAAGSKEKFEQINKLIDMLDEKVQIGSLSQDEENKASDIDKLIADIDGGDLVAALANPSKEQMETLRKHKDKLSWRMKAVLCNFDENKDIAFWFGWSHYAIFGYVRTFLLDVFDMVYDKARVVMTWNKMSKEEQKGIKAVVKVAKEMNDMIEKALRDHDKAIRRETKQPRKRQKKSKTNNTQDDEGREVVRQEGEEGGRKIEIPSKVVDSEMAASSLVSNTHRPKDRPRYASPMQASHINCKQSRAAQEKLQDQFYKTSNTIDPKHKPEDEKWAKRNQILLTINQASSPPRAGRVHSNMNVIVGDPDAVDTNIRLDVAHGGMEGVQDTILNLMRTGQFDDTINKYMEERANGAPPRGNVSFQAVTSKGEMKKLREMEKNNRRRAEKTRTTEDIDNDPNIGAFVEETNDFD